MIGTYMANDDEPPKPPKRPRLQGLPGGRDPGDGGGRKPTRIGSGGGDDDDDELRKKGLITPAQWQKVQQERERTGEPVSLILARLGLASENQVKNALELQYGVNYLSLAKVEPLTAECSKLLPEATMRQHQIVPVAKDGNRVTLAMVNPNNLMALDDVKMRLKGMQVKLTVCTEDDFNLFMEINSKLFGPPMDPKDN